MLSFTGQISIMKTNWLEWLSFEHESSADGERRKSRSYSCIFVDMWQSLLGIQTRTGLVTLYVYQVQSSWGQLNCFFDLIRSCTDISSYTFNFAMVNHIESAITVSSVQLLLSGPEEEIESGSLLLLGRNDPCNNVNVSPPIFFFLWRNRPNVYYYCFIVIPSYTICLNDF